MKDYTTVVQHPSSNTPSTSPPRLQQFRLDHGLFKAPVTLQRSDSKLVPDADQRWDPDFLQTEWWISLYSRLCKTFTRSCVTDELFWLLCICSNCVVEALTEQLNIGIPSMIFSWDIWKNSRTFTASTLWHICLLGQLHEQRDGRRLLCGRKWVLMFALHSGHPRLLLTAFSCCEVGQRSARGRLHID